VTPALFLSTSAIAATALALLMAFAGVGLWLCRLYGLRTVRVAHVAGAPDTVQLVERLERRLERPQWWSARARPAPTPRGGGE
jgi:hypothetical protein